ncbi:MAG: hypothetical protein KKD05_06300 [Candidatus Omnitrophica bacterium]|nr:hypothetical protein [Candidatus Omnitrophota bacterium]
MTYPDSLGTVDYTYDAFNRLTTIDHGLSTVGYEYDVASRLTKKTLPNGVYTDYTYDNANRLTSLINRKSDATVISEYLYAYDDVGNRLSMDTSEGTHDYNYDDIYRLTNADHPITSDETYTYDKVGNRETSADYSDWTYDAENKLTSYDGINYNYDNNGNLIDKNDNGSLTNYTWDYENRLIEVVGAGLASARYDYDPFGKRLSKTVDGVTTYYLYDNEDIVVEYDSAGTVAVHYLHGQGIDEPIAIVGAALASAHYYTFDGLGSVVELTDDTQAVVESYEYDSFGNTTILDANRSPLNASAVGNPYMYTSREYDSETGLYFYRARYYDAGIGRFISQDPIGYIDSVNLYSYVNNSPFIWVDPWGLFKFSNYFNDKWDPMFWFDGNWGGPGRVNGDTGKGTELDDFPRRGDKDFVEPENPRDWCWYYHDVALHDCAKNPCEKERKKCRKKGDKSLADCLDSLPKKFKTWKAGVARDFFRYFTPNGNKPGDYRE